MTFISGAMCGGLVLVVLVVWLIVRALRPPRPPAY